MNHYLKTKKKIYKWTYDFYKSKALLAEKSKEAELDFRRQLLGQKVSNQALKFCEVDRVQYADESVYKDESLRWALGIDPAWRFDFFAASLVGFNESTESIFVKHFLFIADLDKRRPSQKIQFREWDNQGCIQIFNEPTIPRQPVIDTIQGFITEKGIKLEKVIVDPGQAKQWSLIKFLNSLSMSTIPLGT